MAQKSTLAQKFSEYTGLTFNIDELIAAATTDEEKQALYEKLVWDLQNGMIRLVPFYKERVEYLIPALKAAIIDGSDVEITTEEPTTEEPTTEEPTTEEPTTEEPTTEAPTTEPEIGSTDGGSDDEPEIDGGSEDDPEIDGGSEDDPEIDGGSEDLGF